MSLAQNLRTVLSSKTGERALLSWLKEHPRILSQTLKTISPGVLVVAEFPFGTDFRADFVVLDPFSGGWDVHFIELEPPGEWLFTKAGKPAARLQTAVTQVNNWKIFVEKNRRTVLTDLSKFAKERELIWRRVGREPTDTAGWHLYHPRAALNWQYHIIVGRRKGLSEKDMEQKTSFLKTSGVEIMTYDRLLEAARKLDRNDDELHHNG